MPLNQRRQNEKAHNYIFVSLIDVFIFNPWQEGNSTNRD